MISNQCTTLIGIKSLHIIIIILVIVVIISSSDRSEIQPLERMIDLLISFRYANDLNLRQLDLSDAVLLVYRCTC